MQKNWYNDMLFNYNGIHRFLEEYVTIIDDTN